MTGTLHGQGPHGSSRGRGRIEHRVRPDGPALTRLSYGGPGQAKEVATLAGSQTTDVRMLPQCGSLESLAADKLGGVYETGQGSSAACHRCRGERAGNVRPAPSPPSRGGGWPLPATEGGGGGGPLPPVAAPARGIPFLPPRLTRGVPRGLFLQA